MELLEDFLKIALPAALVLFAMYLTLSTLIKKEIEATKTNLISKNQEIITPLRLQAYERLVLLMERISPQSLVLRVNDPSLNVNLFRQTLIRTIREEYNHNITQQIYVSQESWNLVKIAVEDVIGLINAAAQSIEDKEQPSNKLGLLLLKVNEEKPVDTIENALSQLKKELWSAF